jgi:hypothetical protein
MKQFAENQKVEEALKNKYRKILSDNKICPTCYQDVDELKCKDIEDKL